MIIPLTPPYVQFRDQLHEYLKLEDFERAEIDDRTEIYKLVPLAHQVAVREVKWVVRRVSRFIRKQEYPLKLWGVHLLDGIIKYDSDLTAKYRRQFVNCITSLFLMAYMPADTQDRKRLFLFRSSWQWILPQRTLFHLDKTVRGFDSYWLVIEPRSDENKPPVNNPVRIPSLKRVRFQFDD